MKTKSSSSGKVWMSIFLVLWVSLGIWLLISNWMSTLNRVSAGMVFDGYFFFSIFLIFIAGPIYEKKYPEYLQEDSGECSNLWRGYDETSNPHDRGDKV